MSNFRLQLVFVVFFIFIAFRLSAEDAVSNNGNKAIGEIQTLKVYFQGKNIDFDYIRRNVEFVDFVNDPLASDVHVIVTKNATGSGGINYVLNFYGRNFSQIGDITLNGVSLPGDTNDAQRECVTRTLKMGLIPYANETQKGRDINVQYNGNSENTNRQSTLDPWKKWVFRLNANGGGNIEQSIRNYNYSFNVRADKIADKVKTMNSFFLQERFRELKTNDGTLVSKTNYAMANSENVYSLSERWSAGVFVSYFQSSFWNTKYSYKLKPAIEYNFFPWDVADKRIFTVAYFAGSEMKEYIQTTIFGKTEETLWEQNLKLNLELIQPWGEIQTRLEGSTYLHDLSKNSAVFQTNVSLRIMRGLSVNFGFKAENIHNQLYLPAQGASMEDILLGNLKLPSTFDLSGNMGISIQFGSLFNNIINNRL